LPSLSEILSGFKRTTSSTAPARSGLSWATEAVKPVNKTNAEAFETFAHASGVAPRTAGQQSPHTKKNNEKTKYIVYGKTLELTQSAVDYYNKAGVTITRVGSGTSGSGTSNGSTGSPTNPTIPTITNENYITRTKGEFEHDLDQYGYDPLYGQRDFQSDVDIWSHINEFIWGHTGDPEKSISGRLDIKHAEQQQYIDRKIENLYATRRSKKDIEKIIQDYYGDDISRIEGKVDTHGHGFDPIGDLIKSLTSILIIAGVAYVGFKYVLPMVRKRI